MIASIHLGLGEMKYVRLGASVIWIPPVLIFFLVFSQQILSSTKALDDTKRYAVGILSDQELHMTPVVTFTGFYFISLHHCYYIDIPGVGW